jgi:FKBP-type peptidyl-prolyl cis-trans isomerase FkpA
MKFRTALPLLFLVFTATMRAQETAPAPLESYAALGSSFARDNRLNQLGWNEAQVEAFLEGMRATFRGSPKAWDENAQKLMTDVGRRVQEIEQAEKRRRYSAAAFAQPGYLEAYLKEMRTRYRLQATDSGLNFGFSKSGDTGIRPEPEDTVIISYVVVAADGETVIPGVGRQRARHKVKDLLPCLAEVLQMMGPGGAAMAVVPPDLSYGEGEWPPGAEKGTPLVFTVMLHEIVATPVPQ